MSSAIPFGTQLVGQTENAFGAILDRELAGTSLSRHGWVALTVAVMAGGVVPREQFTGRVAGALKLSAAAADDQLAELVAAHLLKSTRSDADSFVEVTDEGRELHARIRSAVSDVTERLWGDLPETDLTVAARVLNTILERANAELAGGAAR